MRTEVELFQVRTARFHYEETPKKSKRRPVVVLEMRENGASPNETSLDVNYPTTFRVIAAPIELLPRSFSLFCNAQDHLRAA